MKLGNIPLPKHVHIIGICGVATSALAIALHRAGVKVTGSDKGFFPPVSTELEKHGVSFYAGWHPEKMIEHGIPDLVVITTASGTHNPETIYAREHNIPHLGYMEVFQKYFIREHSIVATGTWGKTSLTALLSFILEHAQYDPTYMFGGVSLSHDASARLTTSSYSVFEGDEYKSSPTDTTPKFFYYNPTHILLTAVSWDHADLYPTEKSYFDVFNTLIARIPENGLIVANTDHAKVTELLKDCHKKIISYGTHTADYVCDNIQQSRHGIDFDITHTGNIYRIHSPMIGAFQAENITGCFAIAESIGIQPTVIIEAICQFKGLKRRLEKRLDGKISNSGITIFDDIAHSAEKAATVLANLKSIYRGKIIAIFEPNIGGRSRESNIKYDHAFKDAGIMVIPHLTKLKVSEDGSEQPMEGQELCEVIKKTHRDVHYIEDDKTLVDFLISSAKKDDVIVFLGSHGFRGMIEETVKRL
jgi:UDP-N-acetylmuramate: L-alanyl-gamma-D-glutamyl-meso-diaminopimelate ligase